MEMCSEEMATVLRQQIRPYREQCPLEQCAIMTPKVTSIVLKGIDQKAKESQKKQ